MTHDVIVVGAGPAGATTALLLARAGVRVLILDRYAFPRAKPCGDCLSAGTSDVLRRLGLFERVTALPHARLDGWRIVAPNGRSFVARFRCGGGVGPAAVSIQRAPFDAALLDAAIEAGAVFQPNAHVHDLRRAGNGAVTGVDTGRETITARAIVGADGLRSIIAARLGAVRRAARLRKVSLTAHLRAPALASSIGEMHVGHGVVVGVAAVDDDDTCNVTIVADAARFGRAIAAGAAEFAAAAAAAPPGLRDRVPLSQLRTAPLLASGPFDRPVHNVVFDGAALVGDAAGYYDPFTGQGIHQALCSAELIAPVLARALDRGPVTARSLQPYVVQRRALLRGTRALQHIIELWLSRPTAANLAIARLASAGTFASTLIGVTGDMFRPTRLLSPRALLSLIAPGHPLENPV